MDFLKKHYEKIILSLVLLGVVGALVALPFVINQDKLAMQDMADSVTHPHIKPLDPLDLSAESDLLQRVQTPYVLDFSTSNKLFNPVMWKKTPTGDLLKVTTGHEIDAEAAVVTNITPLYFILTTGNIETNVGVRYEIIAERQAAPPRSALRRETHYASVGEKNNVGTIIKVQGDPLSPDELDFKLADTGETVAITKNADGAYKPFERADAYSADIRFDPENKTFKNRRVGAMLTFGDDQYIIVAINQNEVILSAQSNQKKTILHYSR